MILLCSFARSSEEDADCQTKNDDELLDCLLELTNDVVDSLRIAAGEKDRIEANIRQLTDKSQQAKPNVWPAISKNSRGSTEVSEAVATTCEVLCALISTRLNESLTKTQKGQTPLVAISETFKSLLQEDLYQEAAREAMAKLTSKSAPQERSERASKFVKSGSLAPLPTSGAPRKDNCLTVPFVGAPDVDPRATMQVDDMSPRTMGEYQNKYYDCSGRQVSYLQSDDATESGVRENGLYEEKTWEQNPKAQPRETTSIPPALRDWMQQQEDINGRQSRMPTSAGRYVGQVLESVFPEDGSTNPSAANRNPAMNRTFSPEFGVGFAG
eukprot:GEMP01026365.1.p1 GENE.GEMP01026365.1~~GEMP01026365.1.p1  ORF type:complete len:327 (+),score=38.35 GEMP01026365.1:59-1039(+)